MTLSEVLKKARTLGIQLVYSGPLDDPETEAALLLAIVQWLAERGVAVAKSADDVWSVCLWSHYGLSRVIQVHGNPATLAATDFRTAVLAAFDRELDSISAGKASGGGADAR